MSIPRPRATLLLALLLAAGLRAEEPFRLESAPWGLRYEAAGLRPLLDPARPEQLFRGRADGDLSIEITVHETEAPADAAACREALRAQLAKKGVKNPRTGDEPRPWLFASIRRLGVFDELHGHAFYARGFQCFEVHAWVADAKEGSEAAIRAALDGLVLAEDPGCGVKVMQVAARQGKDPLALPVLLEAGRAYVEPNPGLAALVLGRARRLLEPEALSKEDEARLFYLGGIALLATASWAEAAEWLAEAERRAAPDLAPQAAYQLARAAAMAGQGDAAFAALDRAFANGLVVSKARLSKEKELEPLRRDARWETFWMKRIEGR